MANIALATTKTAQDEASEARTTANNALDAAAIAVTDSRQALETANQAQTDATTATQDAEAAKQRADSAEVIAREALAFQSGDFLVNADPVNANALIASNKIYAAQSLSNAPVAAPAYLNVMANSDSSSVSQAVWAENSPAQYLRTGLINWSPTPGNDTFILTATPEEGSPAPGTGALTLQNNGSAMSAAFTPGGFTAAGASALTLTGELRFTLGADFAGAIMWEDMEIIRISNGMAVLIQSEIASDKTGLTLLTAAYAGNTLTITLRADWMSKSHSVAWGEWVSSGGSSIPTGLISMWSGAVAAIPTGWALCDGTKGTPNLRDRFIVGAGSAYAVGATGGATTHTHTLNASSTAATTALTIAQMPAHRHKMAMSGSPQVTTSRVESSQTSGAWYSGSAYMETTGDDEGHTHTITTSATATATNNLPPYYALAYIMKL